MQKRDEEKIEPLHISQAFNLQAEEKDLDFFDANLYYDSLLFLDPFLLKTSPVKEERGLFKKFGVFFKHVYQKALESKTEKGYKRVMGYMNFLEPRELYLGYTRKSNKGSGLANSFAQAMTTFFMEDSARRIIMEDYIYPDNQFNPDILTLISEGVGPDGISDLTARLIMEYLIKYTQNQAQLWKIPKDKLVSLPIGQYFDFKNMEWERGYFSLPENPVMKGEPIVFVPKRLLALGREIDPNTATSQIVGIIKNDPYLKDKFETLISKNISDISIEEIKTAILKDDSIVKLYLEAREKKGVQSYDFDIDILELLAIKKYSKYFSDLSPKKITSCTDLKSLVADLIQIFRTELSVRDGWKDMWFKKNNKWVPKTESSFGRKFRGMGHAYFSHYKSIAFLQEVGTGSGSVDFLVIYLDCRITIEIKLLSNSAKTGKPPIKAYMHGILRQLPEYIYSQEAKYAFYVTGQHRKRSFGSKVDHTPRIHEIEDKLKATVTEIKKNLSDFKELYYFNIDFSPKSSPSKK